MEDKKEIKPEDTETVRVKPDVYIAALLDEANDHLVEIADLLKNQCECDDLDDGNCKIIEDRTKAIKKPVKKPSVGDVLMQILAEIRTRTLLETQKYTDWYDVATQILNSQPLDPLDPSSGIYQREQIYVALERLGDPVHVANDGPGILYVVATSDGKSYVGEVPIYEGEHKIYRNIWELGLRSPVVGLKYRVSERDILPISSEIFTGSRFRDRRDRKGTILFQDDMESPTLKFGTTIVGTGTVLRSSDTSYMGNFSLKTSVGGNLNDETVISYVHPDFHSGRVGVQIKFATDQLVLAAVGVAVELTDFTTGKSTKGFVFIRGNGDFGIYTSFGVGGSSAGGTFSIVLTNIPLANLIHGWNSLKLVVDFSTNTYVRAAVNGIEVNLSNFQLWSRVLGVTAQKYIQGFISVSCGNPGFGCQPVVYVDNYIFTEDEP